MDRGRDSAVEGIGTTVSEDAVTLSLKATKDISMQMWKLKSIKDEFSNIYGRKLRVEHIRRTES